MVFVYSMKRDPTDNSKWVIKFIKTNGQLNSKVVKGNKQNDGPESCFWTQCDENVIFETLVSDSTKLVTQRRSFELLYPKQSIYQSFNSTSPANLFGGTWSSITCPYTNAYAWKRTA